MDKKDGRKVGLERFGDLGSYVSAGIFDLGKDKPVAIAFGGLIVSFVVVIVLVTVMPSYGIGNLFSKLKGADSSAFQISESDSDRGVSESREQEYKTYSISVTVLSEGYDPETSSPIPVHIEGTDFEGNAVSVEALVGASECEQISLMRGTYTLSVASSPFLADGSMFDVSSSQVEFEVVGDIEDSSSDDDNDEEVDEGDNDGIDSGTDNESGQVEVLIDIIQLDPDDLTEESIAAAEEELVSFGFDESEAARYADAARNQIVEIQLAQQLTEAKSKYSEKLAQIASDLENDPRSSGTQMDMSVSAAEYRDQYDALVDEVYSFLSGMLTGDALSDLQSAQSSWEAEKEAAINQIEETYMGGSMISLEINGVAMTYDEERINEMLDMMG